MAISRRDETDAWLGRHRAPLVGYVLPLVNGDRQAAEDVVQETMLRGWQHSAELEPEKAGSWLHAVARNIAISAYHRRLRARPREVPLDETAHVSATVTLTPTSWGTSIQLQVSGVPENVECLLVVRSQGGRTEVSGAWDAWREGPLSIPASASWLPSDIASLQVATPAETLLTISVNHATGEAGQ